MSADNNVLQQFEWSVRALAQDAVVQGGLCPSFAEAADELALDFEERYSAILPMADHFKPNQAQRVEALDSALEAMSGPEHAELWTMEALELSPEWAHIRYLARQVLQIMNWPEGPPPRNRAIYVGAGG